MKMKFLSKITIPEAISIIFLGAFLLYLLDIPIATMSDSIMAWIIVLLPLMILYDGLKPPQCNYHGEGRE